MPQGDRFHAFAHEILVLTALTDMKKLKGCTMLSEFSKAPNSKTKGVACRYYILAHHFREAKDLITHIQNNPKNTYFHGMLWCDQHDKPVSRANIG